MKQNSLGWQLVEVGCVCAALLPANFTSHGSPEGMHAQGAATGGG